MKLRNKKTGKIWHMPRLRQPTVQEDDISFFACIGEHGCSRGELFSYKSLAELNEEWEDYTPAEPLIKDEKKLDTVKSFFALLGITREIYYQSINNCFYKTDDDGITYGIDFDDDNGIDNICTGLPYTIAELCGENDE